ncbi:MAG: prephenate dehydrogenase/arogenate dehydrogenase family protein [Pirellulaceae bacterium]
MKKSTTTVAIVGVGLIGGSIGLALRERGLADRVIGVGRTASRLQQARRRGAVTETTTSLGRGVAEADLVVVCTPVDDVVEHVCAVAENTEPDTLITDVGSTKEHIVKSLESKLPARTRFVGSHPVAGGEKAGVRFARADLFQDRLTILTPGKQNVSRDVQRISRFWRSLGARVVRMTPRQHDEQIAVTSHLPHVLATLLAAGTTAEQRQLVGTGWLDTTRVAAGDVTLWRQIFQQNKVHVLKSVDKFAQLLTSFREALDKDDVREITRLLETGKKHRDSVGN